MPNLAARVFKKSRHYALFKNTIGSVTTFKSNTGNYFQQLFVETSRVISTIREIARHKTVTGVMMISLKNNAANPSTTAGKREKTCRLVGRADRRLCEVAAKCMLHLARGQPELHLCSSQAYTMILGYMYYYGHHAQPTSHHYLSACSANCGLTTVLTAQESKVLNLHVFKCGDMFQR